MPTIREHLRLDDLQKREQATKTSEFDEKPSIVLGDDNRIIIPATMNPDVIMSTVKQYVDLQQTLVTVRESIEGFPTDAALALQKAVYVELGFSDLRSTPGFFGDTPPTFMAVPSDHLGKTVDVYIGRMGLPGFKKAWIQTSADHANMRLDIQGSVKQKDMALLRQLFQTARDILSKESLYRGKAVSLDSRKTIDPETGNFVDTMVPTFWDITIDKPLVLNRVQEEIVNTAIWTPIEQMDRCRRLGVSIKRGAMIIGEYGVGKSLLLYRTAQKAVAAGFTVIYVKDIKLLGMAFMFAQRHYSPCVILCEDAERAFGSDGDIKALQLTLDGLETKSCDISVVMTTNFRDEIPAGIIRPGRIDTRIELALPDAEAAARLVKLYAGDMLDPDADMDIIGEAVAGNIPAMIREIVERSTLRAIARSKNAADDDMIAISHEDIQVSSIQLDDHKEAMSNHHAEPMSVVQELGREIGQHMGIGLGVAVAPLVQLAVQDVVSGKALTAGGGS